MADIEARLDKLRSQLDRRREKKQDIVDLQVKVAINAAEGLGFPGQPNDGGAFNFRIEAPVMVSDAGNVFPPPPVPVKVPMNQESSDLVQ